ncbi:MAG: acyl-CoA dehydrogenase family protein [Thermoplasmata archaeon]
MMDEEHAVLESVIREFAQKEIEPRVKFIETSGIDSDILKKLVSQGFLGALSSPEDGGANLDDLGYMILLRELASSSPSVAFLVFLENSLVIRSLGRDSSVREISTGNYLGTFSFANLVGMKDYGSITVNSRIKGSLRSVFVPESRILLMDDGKGEIIKTENCHRISGEEEQLGFRGLKFSRVEMDCEKYDYTGIKTEEVMKNIHLPVAAMAMGIAKGSIMKAMDYAGQRDAFMHKLKDFQPIAFNLSKAYSELDALNLYLIDAALQRDYRKDLMIKTLSLDFAKRASKLALQTHGGYGYLLDFGIEKFYRDSMFLSVVLGNEIFDMKELSMEIFGSDSGYI